MKITVVIPMYNEASIVCGTAKTMTDWLEAFAQESECTWELIFSDDGSHDGCGEMILAYMDENTFVHGEMKLLTNPENRGKGHAVGLGMAAASGDILLYTDCDLAYGTDVIARIMNTFLETGCDVCIGSRNLTQDGYAGYTPLRKLASRIYIRVLGIVAGFRLSDSQCGIKAFRRQIGQMVFAENRTWGWAFDIEILLRAIRKNAVIREIPVVIVNHRESKIRLFRDSTRMLLDVIRIKKRLRSETNDISSGRNTH